MVVDAVFFQIGADQRLFFGRRAALRAHIVNLFDIQLRVSVRILVLDLDDRRALGAEQRRVSSIDALQQTVAANAGDIADIEDLCRIIQTDLLHQIGNLNALLYQRVLRQVFIFLFKFGIIGPGRIRPGIIPFRCTLSIRRFSSRVVLLRVLAARFVRCLLPLLRLLCQRVRQIRIFRDRVQFQIGIGRNRRPDRVHIFLPCIFRRLHPRIQEKCRAKDYQQDRRRKPDQPKSPVCFFHHFCSILFDFVRLRSI